MNPNQKESDLVENGMLNTPYTVKVITFLLNIL